MHGAGRGQRTERMRDVVIRPEHQLLLRAEGHEEHAARQAPAGQQASHFDHRDRPGPVVVRARVRLAPLRPEVVVVRCHEDRLVTQRGIGAGQESGDVPGGLHAASPR